MTSILGFKTPENAWLSNMALVTIEYDGLLYASVEHAYQAAKTMNPKLREVIRREPNPYKAKELGRHLLELNPRWDNIKLEVMEFLIRQKFAQEPFRSKLIATRDCYIEETNYWGDRFWGKCDGTGKNHLGRLIMATRNTLV
jgi:ribA/ribD-fused uncharacterized protein